MEHIEVRLRVCLNKCADIYKSYPLLNIVVGSFLIIVLSSLLGWNAISAIGTIGAAVLSLYLAKTQGMKPSHLDIKDVYFLKGHNSDRLISTTNNILSGSVNVDLINVLIQNNGDITTELLDAKVLDLKNNCEYTLRTDRGEIKGRQNNLLKLRCNIEIKLDSENCNHFKLIMRDIEGKYYEEPVRIADDVTDVYVRKENK